MKSKRIEELELEIEKIKLTIVDLRSQASMVKEPYFPTEYDDMLIHYKAKLEERKLAEKEERERVERLKKKFNQKGVYSDELIKQQIDEIFGDLK